MLISILSSVSKIRTNYEKEMQIGRIMCSKIKALLGTF